MCILFTGYQFINVQVLKACMSYTSTGCYTWSSTGGNESFNRMLENSRCFETCKISRQRASGSTQYAEVGIHTIQCTVCSNTTVCSYAYYMLIPTVCSDNILYVGIPTVRSDICTVLYMYVLYYTCMYCTCILMAVVVVWQTLLSRWWRSVDPRW